MRVSEPEQALSIELDINRRLKDIFRRLEVADVSAHHYLHVFGERNISILLTLTCADMDSTPIKVKISKLKLYHFRLTHSCVIKKSYKRFVPQIITAMKQVAHLILR